MLLYWLFHPCATWVKTKGRTWEKYCGKKKFCISNNPDSILKRKYGGMFNQNKGSRGNLSRLDHLTRPLCPHSLHLHMTGCVTDATLTVCKCSDVSSSHWNLNWIYAYIDPLQMSVRVAVYIHECIIITIRDQVSPWYANYITKVGQNHCKLCESTLCTVLSKLNTADGHKGNQTAYPSKFFYPLIFHFHKWNEREQTQIIWYFRGKVIA